MTSITVQQLFDKHAKHLQLSWVAGRQGGARAVVSSGFNHGDVLATGEDLGVNDGNGPSAKSLVGHLNLIHPNQIQVLGHSELAYLTGLRDTSRKETLGQVLTDQPVCLVVGESQQPPADLTQACDAAQIPLFASTLSSETLADSFHYYLSNLLAEVVTRHGVFMEVMAIGVLLTGRPGVGKSELALELITPGHRLVADDAPQFSRIAPDIVNGTCSKVLADFLKVRGIGVINIREMFGDSAIKSNKYLRLIINLQHPTEEDVAQTNRLEESYRTQTILNLEVPEITLPVAPARNLAVLVECAARNHILRVSGYNAAEDFIARQADSLAKPGD